MYNPWIDNSEVKAWVWRGQEQGRGVNIGTGKITVIFSTINIFFQKYLFKHFCLVIYFLYIVFIMKLLRLYWLIKLC